MMNLPRNKDPAYTTLEESDFKNSCTNSKFPTIAKPMLHVLLSRKSRKSDEDEPNRIRIFS